MGETDERNKRFAAFLSQARTRAGKSQDYIAEKLDVSKKTIQNWEKGVSLPSFPETMEWFKALNINPLPYYFAYAHPEELIYLKTSDDDQVISDAFDALVNELPISVKRSLLY